jgi:hypothetical protein
VTWLVLRPLQRSFSLLLSAVQKAKLPVALLAALRLASFVALVAVLGLKLLRKHLKAVVANFLPSLLLLTRTLPR